MPNVRCKKCKKIFLTEAPDRLLFPICAGCLGEFRKWLDHQYLDVAAIHDDLYYKEQWVKE